MENLSLKNYIVWSVRIVKTVRWPLLAETLIGFLKVGASLLFVFVCKELIDIATGVSAASLSLYAAALLLIVISQLLLSAVDSYLHTATHTRLSIYLRSYLFNHLLYLRYSGRRHRHTGDTTNRLEEDVQVEDTT